MPRLEDKTIITRVRKAMTVLPQSQVNLKSSMEKLMAERQNTPKKPTVQVPTQPAPAERL